MNAFDKYLHAVIMRAQIEASDEGSPSIEASHLLLAIAAEPDASAQRLLASLGLDRDAIRRALDREFEHSLSVVGVSRASYDLPRATRMPSRPSMGTSAKLALERLVKGYRKKDLRSGHVLLGVLMAEVGTVPRALRLAGIDPDEARTQVKEAL
ncbi:Clp protease N-terminal domain-containing protein [Stackebrandtia nassauensis]|uniref:Clp domain protein n=1 Tax=Stackebrandtia nassauensis (strain DSM 44728 / CIP 108903 / NRRL B-16338 / NBRC 102104 / LLR-40K-21) TaxID=446470 RepID=D3Q7I7_STANL|nr:Clp protease N-terminal domain-containing protein [Stackebrandtia nassauensis]ADD44329.1 Clp domain protein [Stackebrandtia nassauensis DSM 44728]